MANQFGNNITNSTSALWATNILTLFTPPAPGNYTIKGWLNITGSDDFSTVIYRMIKFTDVHGKQQIVNLNPSGVSGGVYVSIPDQMFYLSMNPVTIYDAVQWSGTTSWETFDSGAEVTCP